MEEVVNAQTEALKGACITVKTIWFVKDYNAVSPVSWGLLSKMEEAAKAAPSSAATAPADRLDASGLEKKPSVKLRMINALKVGVNGVWQLDLLDGHI